MTVAISVGLGGLAGWKILQRTQDRQLEALASDASIQRATGYFRDRIEVTNSAEALIADYRMLNVALSAFGLEDDLPNKAFIRQVLESDLSDDQSLANRLGDKRYLRLAQAFDFAGGNRTDDAGFADEISQAFLNREFERRVGQSDETLRLAMNAQRELQGFVGRTSSNTTLWFEVLGNPPLREVFEGAFGFGSAYSQLSVDRQLTEFTKAAERFLGTSDLTEIAGGAKSDRLMQAFLVRSQLTESVAQTRYSAALQLLTS